MAKVERQRGQRGSDVCLEDADNDREEVSCLREGSARLGLVARSIQTLFASAIQGNNRLPIVNVPEKQLDQHESSEVDTSAARIRLRDPAQARQAVKRLRRDDKTAFAERSTVWRRPGGAAI